MKSVYAAGFSCDVTSLAKLVCAETGRERFI
jgi:hypothetical protein